MMSHRERIQNTGQVAVCKDLEQHILDKFTTAVDQWQHHLATDAPETCALNRLHFLAPVFGSSFSDHIRLE